MKLKKIKKITTALLITALAVGTLTGCASSGEEG